MVPGVVLPQLQNCLPLVDLHEIPVQPFLKLAQVILHISLTLWCISPSSKIGLMSNTARAQSPSLLMKWMTKGLDTLLTLGVQQ